MTSVSHSKHIYVKSMLITYRKYEYPYTISVICTDAFNDKQVYACTYFYSHIRGPFCCVCSQSKCIPAAHTISSVQRTIIPIFARGCAPGPRYPRLACGSQDQPPGRASGAAWRTRSARLRRLNAPAVRCNQRNEQRHALGTTL